MKTRYRIFSTESDSEDEEEKYSSFVQEEEFEEECEGFQGVQKGSEIERVWEPTILPWDPSENFFAYI